MPEAAEDMAELDAVTRRFRVCAMLSLPLIAFAIAPHVELVGRLVDGIPP
jgi:hypothetical protein